MNAAVMEVREPSARYLAQVEPALLRGFESMATAPGAVAKLRELILLLAVQGKLVPQDAKEGSGVAILSRLQAESVRFKTTGESKRSAPLVAIEKSEQAFSLPKNWAWARLGWITKAVVDCPHSTPKFIDRGVLCLDTNSFKNGSLIPHKLRYVAEATFAERVARLVPEPGDLVFAREGSVGESVLIPEGTRCCLGQRVMLFRFCEEVSNRFVQQAITSRHFLAALLEMHKGIGAKHVNVGDMRNAVIPIPPLVEQRRIVARVEELMKLCDALEQSGRLADEQHARLTSTLFDALAASESVDALAENWHRVAAHFDLLLDRPQAIDALEQTMLQLAVRGLLVPQDASEGTGDDLLERHVRAARTSGKRARTELLPPTQEDGPFIIPPAWAWTRFGEVADVSGGVTLGRKGALAQPVTLPYLRVANVQRGKLNLSAEVKTVAIDTAELPRFQLKLGDLLITEGGDWDKVGRTCIWREEIATCLHQNHVFKARSHTSEWLPAWGELYLNSADARAYFAASAKQTTNLASINMTELRNCMFPLPPVSEQNRILARVEELRHLCAQLRNRLTEARVKQAMLADVLVLQATTAQPHTHGARYHVRPHQLLAT